MNLPRQASGSPDAPNGAPGGRVSMALLERLQYVTDATLAHLTTRDLLDELVNRLRVVLEADTAAALLFDATDQTLVMVAGRGLETDVAQGVRIPLGMGFTGRVAAEQRTIAVSDVAASDLALPALRSQGIKALLGTPLVLEGAMIGVIHVGMLDPRSFTADDAQLLQLVADRVALALDHVRLFEAERRARLESDAAVRVRDEFLTVAGHELKTPLTAVKGAAQFMTRQLRQPELDRAALDRLAALLEGQIARLELLVQDLLNPARLEQSGVTMAPQDVDLPALGAEILERLDYTPERKPRQRLLLDAPEPIDGRWELLRVDQIITNLVVSVLRDTPDGGTITLGIHRVGDGVEIGVRAESAQPVDPAAHTERASLLLGLYITTQLVAHQGGTITFDMDPGEDMAVRVWLPMGAGG